MLIVSLDLDFVFFPLDLGKHVTLMIFFWLLMLFFSCWIGRIISAYKNILFEINEAKK